MAKIRRIGLFGGSFDPVHAGHIRLAGTAKRVFRLDKVIFIPAYTPPHKKQKSLSSPSRRLKMLSLAIGKRRGFEVSRFEIDRKKPVYTYQTLEHFAKIFKKSRLFFIAGSDSLIDLKKWKKPERILQLAEIISGTRPGSRPVKPAGVSAAGRVHLIKSRFLNVSSTRIRKLAKAGKPLKGLTAGSVASYIRKNELYN